MRIFCYLLSETLLKGLGATGVFLAIAVIARFSRYLDRAADGKLLSSAILPILFWRLPEFLSLALPLALAFGILMVLNRLHSQGEMPMLTQCGIGSGHLLLYFQAAALVVMLLAAFLTLYLAPLGAARQEAVLNNPETVRLVQILSPGKFHTRDGPVFYTEHSVQTEDGTALQEIFIAEMGSADQLPVTTVAKRGRIQQAAAGQFQLILEKGSRYRGMPGSQAKEFQRFDVYRQLLADPWGEERRRTAIKALPTQALMGRLQEEEEARAALQWRLSLPFAVPLMALLAGIFGSRGNVCRRLPGYSRLIVLVIIYLLYWALLTFLREAVAQGRASLPFMYWPAHAALAALILLLLLPAFGSALSRLRR